MKTPSPRILLPAVAALLLTAFGVHLLSAQVDQEFLDSPNAYLGQPRPGFSPLIFAPGIVSASDFIHSAPAVSPDGREIYWALLRNGETPWVRIFYVEFVNGGWSGPKEAPFSGRDPVTNPFFSPDGSRLFFNREDRLMAVQRLETGWSAPYDMGPVFDGIHYQGSMTSDGTIYFCVDMNRDRRDLFRSRCLDGVYQPRENLGPVVNTAFDECEPFIAPDESYLIFASNKPGGYGAQDQYISFQLPDGSWSLPANLGYLVNSGQFESWASVSPDGKYLFYVSTRWKSSPVFWIDARIIDYLKRKITGSSPKP